MANSVDPDQTYPLGLHCLHMPKFGVQLHSLHMPKFGVQNFRIFTELMPT